MLAWIRLYPACFKRYSKKVTLTQDIVELTHELQAQETSKPEFIPRLFVHLAKASVNACQELASVDPSMEKVAERWHELASSLTQLLKQVQQAYPESAAVRELWELEQHATEMSSFYTTVPALD